MQAVFLLLTLSHRVTTNHRALAQAVSSDQEAHPEGAGARVFKLLQIQRVEVLNSVSDRLPFIQAFMHLQTVLHSLHMSFV